MTTYGKHVVNTYPVIVNYDLSVEDAVELGLYNWVNWDISSRNFSTKRSGTAEIVVELIHFNCYIFDDTLKELDRQGYRPDELHELLAFGQKYPDVQLEFPIMIMALGSVWQGRYGYRYIPYLRGYGSERYLGLNWIGSDWNEIFRFAAVHK